MGASVLLHLLLPVSAQGTMISLPATLRLTCPYAVSISALHKIASSACIARLLRCCIKWPEPISEHLVLC